MEQLRPEVGEPLLRVAVRAALPVPGSGTLEALLIKELSPH